MAIACLRLLTFRPDPLFSVPFFRRRIVDSTFFEADLPYFAIAYVSFVLTVTSLTESETLLKTVASQADPDGGKSAGTR